MPDANVSRSWPRLAAISAACAAVIASAAFYAGRNVNNSSVQGGGAPPEGSAPRSEIAVPEGASSLGWPGLLGPGGDCAAPDASYDQDFWPSGGSPPVVWRRPIGRGYSAPVVQASRLTVFHRQGDDEVIESLDAATGESRWAYRYTTAYKCRYQYSNGPYSTPLLDGDRLYAIGAEGKLHCLALADGALRWRRDLATEYGVEPGFFAVAASPLVEGDLLIVNVGGREAGAGLVAFDKHTGEERWRATDDGAGYATPVAATLHGMRLVFAFTADGLVALRPESGDVLWEVPFRANHPEKVNATSPLIVGDRVVVTGYSLGGLCVRVLPDGGYEELWRERRSIDSQFNNLLAWGDRLYGCSALGWDFRCLDAGTGEVLWEWPLEIGRGAASIRFGDRALLLGEDGRLAILGLAGDEPELLAISAEPLLAAPCFSAPAWCAGRLYVRNESELVCVDLRPPSPASP